MKNEIVFVGVNANKNIWGYLKSYEDDADAWRPEVYSFWGKYGGAIRFSRVYYNSDFYSSRRQKLRVYTRIESTDLDNKIFDEFNQLMVIKRLKYNY